ncbi:MAG: isopentenyl phosphate kinase family protein [Methanomicrobiales archaeon]|nr:isopentenyl phosphate kinase family protein [Methanomicrobiales archaeon]
MKERLLVKLGGSVITDKAGDCTINRSRLEEIAEILASHAQCQIILVHGAGSCGHPEAKRHHLDKGVDQNNISGIFITHQAVRKLNDAVVNALRTNGVEAIGMHPLDACVADEGRIVAFDCEPIRLLVEHGVVPVLHGDVVMDRARGACIASGDQLIRYLARPLGVDRIGLATDVAGVLTNGTVIPRIDEKTAETLSIGESANTDVTGGMKGKISELLALAREGTESEIFHVSCLGDFLAGRNHGGTVVKHTIGDSY